MITNTTPKDTERIKKDTCEIFKNNGLRITIDAEKQIANFLDVTFNFAKNIYNPYIYICSTTQTPQYLNNFTDI